MAPRDALHASVTDRVHPIEVAAATIFMAARDEAQLPPPGYPRALSEFQHGWGRLHYCGGDSRAEVRQRRGGRELVRDDADLEGTRIAIAAARVVTRAADTPADISKEIITAGSRVAGAQRPALVVHRSGTHFGLYVVACPGAVLGSRADEGERHAEVRALKAAIAVAAPPYAVGGRCLAERTAALGVSRSR